MNPTFFWILLVFLSVDTAALIVLLFNKIRKEWRQKKIRHFGDRAEMAVSNYIEKEFPGAVLLNNVFLKTKEHFTQIDHILLCKWGVYVIETKSHNGHISSEKREWVQFYNDKVIRFHSPVLQNANHCKALEYVLQKNRSLRGIPVKGVVVFTSRKVTFSKPHYGVIRLFELGPFIKSGGKTTRRRGAVTADPRGFYLTKNKILALEKAIRKGSAKSMRRKREHERRVRRIDGGSAI